MADSELTNALIAHFPTVRMLLSFAATGNYGKQRGIERS
jgi:hypothetical protein